MISNKNAAATAVGGKTARACDSCMKKRARWYCAADDAFLCQACDASVHSANPLARRHDRVRLKTASSQYKSFEAAAAAVPASFPPSWHGGFTRKARTPRQYGKFSNKSTLRNSLSLVPELANSDENSHEEDEEEHLLYRVPIYDPFAAELCTSGNYNEAEKKMQNECENVDEMIDIGSSESKVVLSGSYGSGDIVDSLHGFQFIPTDMELAEFAADVESLLGRGLENESFVAMEELGLADYSDNNINKEKDNLMDCSSNNKEIKIEEELLGDNDDDGDGVELMREPFELKFDYDSDEYPATCTGDREDEEEGKVIKGEVDEENGGEKKKKKRKILLRLDYEGVISAWATSQGASPWTTGDRPDFDPDECWPDCGAELHYPYVDLAGMGIRHPPAPADGGREARVSRYREKRRTRLFSKKIRYEVRKLNAEKRPRMKGRFVKRASIAGAGAGPPAIPKQIIIN